jgi:hypothetical protein
MDGLGPHFARLTDNLDKLSASDRSFAESLIAQGVGRGLSMKQLEWVRRLAERAEATARPRLVGFAPIVTMMLEAQDILRRPKMVVRAGELDIRLSVAGQNSRTPGCINITSPSGDFETRKFYGRIGKDGVFDPSLSIEPDAMTAIVTVLRMVAADPAAAAAEYGRISGSCSFCGLPLSDVKSLRVGYGRICSRRFGLPWG